jgi:hypothetical protein
MRTAATGHMCVKGAGHFVVCCLLMTPLLHGQEPTAAPAPAAQAAAPEAGPIAIVPIDTKSPDAAANVTGALEVSQGNAIIAASGSVTSGSETTEVILPHRGVLRVCASTTVHLAADANAPSGQTPGLMMSMDHGALELDFAMSFAARSGAGRNADILLTPDFRILIGAPGAAEVKVRLGQRGDTCVDNAAASALVSNAGTNAPYVLVTSVFDGGNYRVQAGQRVMFEHGSLREVVDNEKEPCGCPPAAPKGNEFPLAQSEGLAPLPKPAPSAVDQNGVAAPIEPLVYKSADHAAQPAAATPPAGAAAEDQSAATSTAQKKPGFLGKIGRFFKRVFGAE